MEDQNRSSGYRHDRLNTLATFADGLGIDTHVIAIQRLQRNNAMAPDAMSVRVQELNKIIKQEQKKQEAR